MSDYSKNYHKLMSEKKDQIAAAFKVAKKIAMNHELHFVCDTDSGERYPLAEMLTLKGQPISNGEEEIDSLIDNILVDAIMAYEGLIDA